ncbi:MAG: hypothetical protein DMG13_06880 [Acidobacteria bacterium]|nr:MAG: hypothetical protein DMG13_06880 [Acidobacteriota bacterium]
MLGMKMTHCIVRLALIVCLAAAAGCGLRIAARPAPLPASASSPPEPVNACELISEPGEPVGTVALSEPVDPSHAPYPSNESERLLFRQLYETLVRVNCDGRVVPGLADSWKFDANARAWIVTLRPNPRFSDGTPVTAADVASAWSNGGRLVRSVRAVDDRTLEITLRNPSADAPLPLAHTDLAIARRIPGSRWPLGTRAATVASDGPLEITVENPSPVRFVLARNRDVRDLLDQGVDLLLTRDERALDYGATLPQFVSLPLAWQRTRVLLTPGRTARSLSTEERQSLADDAVQGPARGAAGPFWWQWLPECEIANSPKRDPSPSSTGRIVYDGSDSAARELAERLVALARTSGTSANRPYQSASGLTGDALVQARRRGADAAYIISLDTRPLDPCREMQALVDNAGWIDPETIIPLVDTRLEAIVRRGRSGVTVDGDGGLLLGVPGR